MNSQGVNYVPECFFKPKYEVEESKQPIQLSPWELRLLGIQPIQKGLLFLKPHHGSFSMERLLECLKDSLALTLVHFYPLAGQLASTVDPAGHRSFVFVDSQKGPGVKFIHATSGDVHVSDLLSPTDQYTPSSVVNSFFGHHTDGEVNYDGHSRPLLTVQVTELVDGIFIGCSMNHAVADGTSYWHFWNVWSQIHQAGGCGLCGTPTSISPPQIHNRWIPEEYSLADFFLPFIHPDEFIRRCEPSSQPELRERYFHFSSESIAALKTKANEETSSCSAAISSFQALTALVWRCIIRARGLDPTQATNCKLMVNNRGRLAPPLPQEYFGVSLSVAIATTKVGELLQHGLEWASLSLNKVVAGRTDKAIRDSFMSWLESPFVADPLAEVEETVAITSSPRFRVYENQFEGLGKPLAVRSGAANKFGGMVTAFPGYEGEGSVDLEICLPPQPMKALELDLEFMAYVSLPH